MKDVRIMNPLHPSWGEFLKKMRALNEEEHSCEGDTKFTEKILETFPNIDVVGSLHSLCKEGDICDCKLFEEVFELNPVHPEYKWITCDEIRSNGAIWCAIEDTCNWLGQRGFSKEYILKFVMRIVIDEI